MKGLMAFMFQVPPTREPPTREPMPIPTEAHFGGVPGLYIGLRVLGFGELGNWGLQIYGFGLGVRA